MVKNVHVGANVHMPASMWPNEVDPPPFYEGEVVAYTGSFSGRGCTQHRACPCDKRDVRRRWDIHTEDVGVDGSPIVYYLCWPALKDMLVLAVSSCANDMATPLDQVESEWLHDTPIAGQPELERGLAARARASRRGMGAAR